MAEEIAMKWLLSLFVLLALPAASAAQEQSARAPVPAGVVGTDIAFPAHWNGTLLLWSRGYSLRAGGAESAPADVRDLLLQAGYALAGSDYGSGGWALEQAVPAQIETIAAFTAQYGRPRRVIAWGNSMGGLVTTALAEREPAVIDGGVAMCSSIGGSLGMMNMALDGAFAFRTLITPDAGIQLTGIADDRANGALVGTALAEAMRSPQGRARVMLAGVLAGLPGWTTRDGPRPVADDAEAQVAEIAKTFVFGVMLPRADQEARAGIGYSWNTGVDYRAQLRRSGRWAQVAALYRTAGLRLEDDLARLAAAPRIAASPAAVAYMQRNYTPNARPTVPLLAVQAIGDGATSPSLQQGYAAAADPHRFASLWLNQAGHCGFTPAQALASIRVLEARLDSGRWPRRPAGFVNHRPAPMLRSCFRGQTCR